MAEPLRLMLVDDHAVVRAGYRMLLREAAGVEIVAEAGSGERAYRLYRELRPDVVAMDLSLPGMGGLEAIKRIVNRDPAARILVVSMHDSAVFVEHAIAVGARGYIAKNSAPETLLEAVAAVAKGEQYLDPRLAGNIALRKTRAEGGPLAALSTREFEIFCLLAEGVNINDIARRLSISYKTVANYSAQVKNKLRVNTAAELTRLAIRCNILQP